MQSDYARHVGASFSPHSPRSEVAGSTTIYHGTTPFCLGDDPIPLEILAYYRADLSDQLRELIWQKYTEQKKIEPGLTQAKIARRLDRRPEQIHRWFTTRGNLQSDTVSDLLLAIAGYVPVLDAKVPSRSENPKPEPGSEWAMAIPSVGRSPQPMQVGGSAVLGSYIACASSSFVNPAVTMPASSFALNLGNLELSA